MLPSQASPPVPVNSAVPASHPASKTPAHEHVYRALRDNILFGDYAPGQPLTIQGLVADTGAGMTPVREAIRRLISEGAVQFLGNRRLCLPVLTPPDVRELAFMRLQLEPELARRAVVRVHDADIAALRDCDTELNTMIQRGDIAGYLRCNYRFHARLYECADAPILSETVDRLWLRFGPSLRVVCGRFGTLNLPDMHADILAALEMGDGEAAAHALREDAAQGMDQILRAADSIDAK